MNEQETSIGVSTTEESTSTPSLAEAMAKFEASGQNAADSEAESPTEAVATTTEAEPLPEEDNKSDMQSDPLMIIVMFGASLFMFKMWLDDFFSARKGNPHPKAFPGAVACPPMAVIIAVIGALFLVLVETGGEYALGVSAEQSDITWLFLLSMIAAAFIEELIFRGFLVIDKKGTKMLIGSIVLFSFLFAILHPFMWDLELPSDASGGAGRFWRGEWTFDFGVKAWFSTIIVFVNSLWFYAVRFYSYNPERSLIPCMAAHFASNIGVFVIKLAQGHVVGIW